MKNLTVFGKETMRRQRETYRVESNRNQRTGTRRTVRCKACVFALFLCGILCGCTRREQLVLEIGDAAQETRSEVPKLQTDIVADVAERTGEVHASGAENAESARAEDAGKEKTASVQIQEPENIFVHVCGAVVSPGVYEMPADSRIYEAVEKAGGFAEDADSSYVNQAGRYLRMRIPLSGLSNRRMKDSRWLDITRRSRRAVCRGQHLTAQTLAELSIARRQMGRLISIRLQKRSCVIFPVSEVQEQQRLWRIGRRAADSRE